MLAVEVLVLTMGYAMALYGWSYTQALMGYFALLGALLCVRVLTMSPSHE